ncbi:hypothetical protein SETIT_2G272900v2 [Setaria italica]|uniref:Uncharacterized protein n=2 Tax=Setaria TaxID=4554 RepID=A0A368Q3A0_SETIT|nr:hypothetical protein SETIT_2G272900v2 [Setaria italica]TKW34122.1 hypothetical protein SEVIR_2G283700v2 [Setaria viridis]
MGMEGTRNIFTRMTWRGGVETPRWKSYSCRGTVSASAQEMGSLGPRSKFQP